MPWLWGIRVKRYVVRKFNRRLSSMASYLKYLFLSPLGYIGKMFISISQHHKIDTVIRSETDFLAILQPSSGYKAKDGYNILVRLIMCPIIYFTEKIGCWACSFSQSNLSWISKYSVCQPLKPTAVNRMISLTEQLDVW